MSAASRGHARERQVRKVLEQRGWWVSRAAGSLGDADIIALKAGERPRLCEIKANKDGGPFKNFQPADRSELLRASEKAGADALLVYWPAHKPMRLIPSKDWP